MAFPRETPVLYCARFLVPITTAPLEHCALLVQDGMIRACGARHELVSAYPVSTVVDFGDAVILPPMVNAHTHLELSDFPLWAAAAGEPETPQDFVDWILRLVRVKRNLSPEQLHASLSAGLQASLRAGTGAVGDILTSLEAVSAYRSSPMRGRIFAEVLGYDQTVVARRLKAIERVVRNLPSPTLDWGLSPHAPYTLSSATINQVFAYANLNALQCAIHLAESNDESCFLRNGSGAIAERLYVAAQWDPREAQLPGCTPVHALCRQHGLKSGDLAIHGVHVDSADIELLKQAKCGVVLCPRSNAALSVGKAPVAAYLAAGVPLALGTDSLASVANLSIWEEISFALDWFAGQAEPRDWLEIATLGGARGLGLEGRLGQLASGCEASFQVVTLPELPVLSELEEALCASGDQITVTHLFLAARNVLPQS